MKRYLTLALAALLAFGLATTDAKPRKQRYYKPAKTYNHHRHYNNRGVLTQGGDVLASEWGTDRLEGYWWAPTGENKADEERLEIHIGRNNKVWGSYEGHYMSIDKFEGEVHGTAVRVSGRDEESGGYVTLLFRLLGPDELEMASMAEADALGKIRFHRDTRR